MSRIQKLQSRIQKLAFSFSNLTSETTRIQKLEFRNYPNSETILQQLFFANSETANVKFRNLTVKFPNSTLKFPNSISQFPKATFPVSESNVPSFRMRVSEFNFLSFRIQLSSFRIQLSIQRWPFWILVIYYMLWKSLKCLLYWPKWSAICGPISTRYWPMSQDLNRRMGLQPVRRLEEFDCLECFDYHLNNSNRLPVSNGRLKGGLNGES